MKVAVIDLAALSRDSLVLAAFDMFHQWYREPVASLPRVWLDIQTGGQEPLAEPRNDEEQ